MVTMIPRFLVGAFAGALASFFPRLVAVLGGNPNDNVVLFSSTYLVVGSLVALAVGAVVLIIDSDPKRQLRDVFTTALGVPTLLMGALTTGATVHNATLADLKIQTISQELANKNQIQIRSNMSLDVPAAAAPAGEVGLLDLLIPSAHAQSLPQGPQASRLGIALREPQFITVYQEARDGASLRPLQLALAQRGLPSRLIELADGRHLLVAAGAARPYSDAVLEGARAKEAGAMPYLVPAAPH